MFSIFQTSFGVLKTWDGGASTSNWADANNWFPDGSPTIGDSVYLDNRFVTSSYTVFLPNTAVTISSLSIYPSELSASIILEVPNTNNVNNNLRVTGAGFNSIAVGNRGRINNNSAGNSLVDVFKIDDIANFGLLLDEGGYYYHGSMTRDTSVLRNLSTRLNSTFEYDKPAGSYDVMIFPVTSQIGSITFYHLIFSGIKAGVNRPYGGTLANNWDLIINGNLLVRDKASFGVVRGAVGQVRGVYLRGNVTISNTTATLWFEFTSSISFGWNVYFDGITKQTINGRIVLLEKTTINNSAGIDILNTFEIKEGGFAAEDPKLVLTNGTLNTFGTGLVFININSPTSKIEGHTSGGSSFSNSYISGKLKQLVQTNGTYEFPVGLNSYYELCSITFSGMSGVSDLSINFIKTGLGSIPTALPEGGDNYDQLLNAGFWRIIPTGSITAGTYSVNLYETGYTQSATKYRIVKRINGANPWAFEGSHGTYNQSVNVVNCSRTSLNAFSDFAIALPAILLPVEFLNFELSLVENKVKIDWETNFDKSNDYFTIEKSYNSNDWQVLQNIENQPSNKYSAFDNLDFNSILYYRIKQTDFNGNFSYSQIKSISSQNYKNQNFQVYPNPTIDFIYSKNFSFNDYKIFNLKGEVIHLNSTQKETNTLDLRELPAGIYYILTNLQTFKIIKN